MSHIRTQSLGYPRIGAGRELKKTIESFWRGDTRREDLERTAADLRRTHWETQRTKGIDLIPCNDFSLYDQVLDMTCLLGNIPERFGWDGEVVDTELYFRMARGTGIPTDACCGGAGTAACEMTKWFDTNYHYLVPEFNEATSFNISSEKVFKEFQEAKSLGFATRPVLIGPLTYLTIGKEVDAGSGFDRFELTDKLIDTYVEIFERLALLGVVAIQIDEPAFALDLDDRKRELATKAFTRFRNEVPGLDILVTSYFGELRENLKTFTDLPVKALHIDGVRAAGEVPIVVSRIAPSDKSLSIGVVDGRNIWKTDLSKALSILKQAVGELGAERVIVAPSCSLLHVPVSLAREREMESEIRNWLAFADEKLSEVDFLRRALEDEESCAQTLTDNRSLIESRRTSERVRNPEVRARIATLREGMFARSSEFPVRQALQRQKLQLPLFPTTTIGSFPQTADVRKARARFRTGSWTADQYQDFLKNATIDCIKAQEEAGLDVLVHGEFERNDMVEYFGERLDGFIFSRYGWVQSYGSRCVKPPIIFGDVSRPKPMTVDWAVFATNQTERPMKGMLTGPVTILQWSFVRDDQPRRDTTFQIALAIRDEVQDLEAAGLPIIQIDEAAIREGLPLRRSEWKEYFEWAVRAFRLSASGVKDDTQVHTHMCYSEFGDMLEAIIRMDADVITIENARSNSELVDAFSNLSYPNEIGPGVYDIHSPHVPDSPEMEEMLDRIASVFPSENIWVNPDCGLKTRSWEDVKPALKNMVNAAVKLRAGKLMEVS